MLNSYLEFVSRTPILWLSFILMNLFTFGVFANLPDLEAMVIDRMYGYSLEEALAVLDAVGQKGREVYLWANSMDMVYPLFYGSFLVGVLYRFPLHERLWWLALMPVFAGLCDEVENYHIRQMLLAFPLLKETEVAVASLFTQAKWVLVSFSFLMGFLSLFVVGLRKFTQKEPAG